MSVPIYLVCDGCGFFYGDIRLYEQQTVDCPKCGTTVAHAYGQLDHALDWRDMFAPRDGDFGPSHPEHPGHVCGPRLSDGGYACDMCGAADDSHTPDCPWRVRDNAVHGFTATDVLGNRVDPERIEPHTGYMHDEKDYEAYP
jgi:hypothetical protein